MFGEGRLEGLRVLAKTDIAAPDAVTSFSSLCVRHVKNMREFDTEWAVHRRIKRCGQCSRGCVSWDIDECFALARSIDYAG